MSLNKIIKPHGSGLFSNLNKVLTIAEHLNSTDFFVDWKGMNYYGENGENVWNWFFEERIIPNNNIEIVSDWPHYNYTGPEVAKKYEGDKSWRFNLNNLLKELKIKESFFYKIDDFFNGKGNPLGVLVRATPLLCFEQPNGRMPSFENYCEAIDKHLKEGQKIFLMTDNDEDLHRFSEFFKDKIFYREHRRSYSSQIEFHTGFQQNRHDVEECFLEALCLSKCDTLIHPVSNIATFALYCDPELNHHFLQYHEEEVKN